MQDASAETIDQVLDEALEESFPASDPLSFWSGRDPAGWAGEVPEAVPEVDYPRTARASERSDAIEGPAPTS